MYENLQSPMQASRGFWAANHPAVSANENVTINIPSEKPPEEWPPYLPQQLKQRNGTKDRRIRNKTFQIMSDDARSLMTRDIRCNQMKKMEINRMLILDSKSSYVPPFNTVPHSGQIESCREVRLRPQHSTICLPVVEIGKLWCGI